MHTHLRGITSSHVILQFSPWIKSPFSITNSIQSNTLNIMNNNLRIWQHTHNYLPPPNIFGSPLSSPKDQPGENWPLVARERARQTKPSKRKRPALQKKPAHQQRHLYLTLSTPLKTLIYQKWSEKLIIIQAQSKSAAHGNDSECGRPLRGTPNPSPAAAKQRRKLILSWRQCDKKNWEHASFT